MCWSPAIPVFSWRQLSLLWYLYSWLVGLFLSRAVLHPTEERAEEISCYCLHTEQWEEYKAQLPQLCSTAQAQTRSFSGHPAAVESHLQDVCLGYQMSQCPISSRSGSDTSLALLQPMCALLLLCFTKPISPTLLQITEYLMCPDLFPRYTKPFLHPAIWWFLNVDHLECSMIFLIKTCWNTQLKAA